MAKREQERKANADIASNNANNAVDSNPNPGDNIHSQWLTFESTAYTAGPESTGKSPGDADYGITASGRHVRENHTIACPKSIALDTRMEIEGLGVRTCDDRGGAITDGRLDIYFEDVAEAREFGRRTVRARIIEN
ncbi:3D domain-containing protein [Mesobacillus zeae]|uniref:3D domain-containing protein n=1 Tax=Mesobacillus zeae TaxID=1917180 RepID=UPI003AB4DB7E